MPAKSQIIPVAFIEQRIFLLRGEKAMLDFHLAELYAVETKALKRAVRRNRARFPSDFCFELSPREWENLRCQFGTSSWGGARYPPFGFTEEGVAMLSGVLNSPRAVRVNIQIMRAFVRLRRVLTAHPDLARKLRQLERRIGRHDEAIGSIFEARRRLMAPPDPPKRRIGFRPE